MSRPNWRRDKGGTIEAIYAALAGGVELTAHEIVERVLVRRTGTSVQTIHVRISSLARAGRLAHRSLEWPASRARTAGSGCLKRSGVYVYSLPRPEAERLVDLRSALAEHASGEPLTDEQRSWVSEAIAGVESRLAP